MQPLVARPGRGSGPNGPNLLGALPLGLFMSPAPQKLFMSPWTALIVSSQFKVLVGDKKIGKTFKNLGGTATNWGGGWAPWPHVEPRLTKTPCLPLLRVLLTDWLCAIERDLNLKLNSTQLDEPPTKVSGLQGEKAEPYSYPRSLKRQSSFF